MIYKKVKQKKFSVAGLPAKLLCDENDFFNVIFKLSRCKPHDPLVTHTLTNFCSDSRYSIVQGLQSGA